MVETGMGGRSIGRLIMPAGKWARGRGRDRLCNSAAGGSRGGRRGWWPWIPGRSVPLRLEAGAPSEWMTRVCRRGWVLGVESRVHREGIVG